MASSSREARRRKILERGSDRLAFITGKINGVPPPPSSDPTSLQSHLPTDESSPDTITPREQIHTDRETDLYGFWIGCYSLRVIYIGSCFILNHIMIRRTDLLLNLVLLWIRNALLFSIWVSFIPTMLGLLIDLMIIIPSQVPLNEPPVYSLLQDWFIGLVVLHIWTYLTMFTRVNCFATVAWREKLKKIRSVGINRLPWTWLLGNVMCPIMGTLLTTLAFPFWVAYSLFPLLQFSGAVDQAVQRLIWPVLLAIIIIGFVAKLTIDLFHYIHRLEYDDRYMVGDRVSDFIEDHDHE